MGSTQPRPSEGFMRYLWLYNPMYLLSSVCMLGSCVLLANDSVHSHVPLSQLLSLVGTLVLYQAALFAIGAFLVLSRNILRDGRTLLILDAVFLTDITFVNAELITTRLMTGLGIGLLLVALAGLRIGWISQRMGSPMPLHRYVLILLQLAMITLIPSYLKHIDTGTSVTASTLYAMWWVAAVLTGGGVIIDTLLRREPAAALPARAAWVQPTYVVVPFLSLMLHLAVLHYVYDVALYVAMLAPQMVAGAMFLRRMAERRPDRFGVTVPLQVGLLALGLIAGLTASSTLELRLGLSPEYVIALPAGKMTFAALYMGVVYIYFRRHARWFLAAGAAVAGMVLFGPGPQQVWQAIVAAIRALGRAIVWLMPATRVGWGILGIIASFGLLGLGTWISLRRPPEDHGSSQDPAAGPLPPEPALPVKEVGTSPQDTPALAVANVE